MKSLPAVLLGMNIIAASLWISLASSWVPESAAKGRRFLELDMGGSRIPANLSFAAAKERYLTLIDDKPYRDAVENTTAEFCFEHTMSFWRPACDQTLPEFDAQTCCTALQAYVDEGMCLCHPGELVVYGPNVTQLLAATECSVRFPIPENDINSILQLEQCIPSVELNPPGRLVPEFVNLTAEELDAITNPSDLPSFLDLYRPPPRGPFNISSTRVNVTRPEPSIIINRFSTPLTFEAIIFYPSDDTRTNASSGDREVNAQELPMMKNQFPIIALSPGFTASPEFHLSTMEHLASLGFIVISQASTQAIGFEMEEALQAWPNDIAFMLLWLEQQGRTEGSFLHCAVDAERVGIAGFSMGGAMAPAAALKANELGIPVNAVISMVPPCVVWGEACDIPSNTIPRLLAPNYLFIAAEFDTLAPPRVAEFFQSLVPESISTEFTLLEGATHCVLDVDPALWPGSLSNCGLGTKAPQEAVREMNQRVGDFLKLHLVDAFAPSSRREDASVCQ